MLLSIDIKIECINFTADTDCMLLLLSLFSATYLFFVYLLIKDMDLPKQYKNKEGVKISTVVFIQTIVLVSELTP